jgi:hypothetical protein
VFNYTHKKLIERITALDSPPSGREEFAEWIKAEGHLELLRLNAKDDEVVVYALGEYSLIHSAIVPNERLSPPDLDDLLGWNFNAYKSIASYITGGACEGVWLERGLSSTGTKTLEGAVQPVLARTFEGWAGPGRDYLELHQEYAHLTGSHWRPEKRAFCRFDEHGDLEHVVTVTNREDKGSNMALVTFKWEPLEEYLAASDSSVVRMFDFTLFRRRGFSGWSRERDEDLHRSEDFFYRQKIDGPHAAYTRGVQIIRPRGAVKAVHTGITDGWFGRKDKQYTEFIAYDWRNKRVRKISTDPAATTNYFEAEGSTRPFELSPAFFKPEVLSKYKTDRDKYTVGERDVSCRAAWNLKAIDVNAAGQVHAYIVYLRNLPHAEQLHWLSYNEEPKAGISERAVTTDFKGEWTDLPNPLQEVLSILRRWDESKASWWTLRDRKLMEHINTPLTSSRDEWAQSFLDLSQLVVEGFGTDAIRAKLGKENVVYSKEAKSIALLERLLYRDGASENKLEGLRSVQYLRNKTKGHAGSSEAAELAQQEHETFANHFRYVCQKVAADLEAVERRFA